MTVPPWAKISRPAASEAARGCAVALITAYFMIVRYAMRVAQQSQDKFGRLLASGLGATIFYYFSVNMMMVMGLAPVVGIPLPLFSYGGSSMLTIMTCVGIVLAIENDSKTGSRRFH